MSRMTNVPVVPADTYISHELEIEYGRLLDSPERGIIITWQ